MQTHPFSRWWFIPWASAVGFTIGQAMKLYGPDWSLLRRILHFGITVAFFFGLIALMQYWAIKEWRKEQQR